MANPPIKPDQLRLIFVNQLAGAQQPIVQEGRIGIGTRIKLMCLVFRPFHHGGRTIKIRIGWIVDIRIELAPAVHKPPMLGAVAGEAKDQPMSAYRGGQFADQIALGAHFGRGPFG